VAVKQPSVRTMNILVITGMHRSGTSLCARICQALGVYLGEDLLTGKADNPDGYFEDRTIVQTHRRLAAALGPGWMLEQSVRRMPDNWWQRPELCPQLDLLRDRIATIRRHAAGRIPGFKDPRTARLLPVWNDLFERMGLKPGYLLCLRHPKSVVESLAKRNRFAPAHSELMWLQHTIATVRHTQGKPVTVISYERWFAEPESQIAELVSFLRRSNTEWSGTVLAIHKIIDVARNHSSAAPFCPTFPVTLRLYNALLSRHSMYALPPAVWEAESEFVVSEEKWIRSLDSEHPFHRKVSMDLDNKV
jgi:hypothetical protein